MKNQYVGDINDYYKYGLLRCLHDETGWRTTVCWMLTPNDGRSDGRHIDYLHAADHWRAHDPALFDALGEFVGRPGGRNVRAVEEGCLLPRTRFHPELLQDEAADRGGYFARLWALAEGSDLIFFDPDNGLAVPSVRRGRRGSCRYLYWEELREAFGRGCALLVYQHFPRVARDRFIARCAGEILGITGAREVHALQTARVVLFLVPQPPRIGACRRAGGKIAEQWSGRIAVQAHRRARLS